MSKKKFIKPEVEVIDFSEEDIITLSNAGDELIQDFITGGEDYEG